MTLLERIQKRTEELTAWRRDLHRHPETAFEERRTADFVAERLQSFGIAVHRGLGRTGVVGTLRKGPGSRSIGLRADMDALDVEENSAASHCSTHEGKMHACGHDGHTVMLLGAAQYLAESGTFDGTVYFIFQPAEENEGGGRLMIEDGLFREFPCESVFGMHNWPGMPAGNFGLRPGPMMASFDTFEIQITGRGTHAAQPHTGVDSVLAASHLVVALQSIVSRAVSPLDSAVVTVTQIHAGDTWNVIPGTAIVRGTARAFRPETRALLERRVSELAHGIAGTFGATASVRYERRYPPTVNAEPETARCTEVLRSLVGAEHVEAGMEPTMGSEDFAFMLAEKPGCYVFIGNGSESFPLHNPHYDFNDAILPLGASYWVKLAENILR